MRLWAARITAYRIGLSDGLSQLLQELRRFLQKDLAQFPKIALHLPPIVRPPRPCPTILCPKHSQAEWVAAVGQTVCVFSCALSLTDIGFIRHPFLPVAQYPCPYLRRGTGFLYHCTGDGRAAIVSWTQQLPKGHAQKGWSAAHLHRKAIGRSAGFPQLPGIKPVPDPSMSPTDEHGAPSCLHGSRFALPPWQRKH